MSLRLYSVFSIVVIISSFLLGLVHGAGEVQTRIGNETIERTVQLRTHSLYAPYIDQDLHNRWWDFGADSYVNTNKHIRLTRNKRSQMGWLWSRLVLGATNFIVELEFKISVNPSHLYGDGMAVWLTKERAKEGPVFGNKDKFEVLGIFIDTYQNAPHAYAFPRISAMLGDGKTSFDVGNDGHEQSIGGCSANIRRTNVATKLKITYVKNNFLDVKVQYKAWDDWSDCFHIKNFALTEAPYLGLTAMTGEVSDAHDIVTVNTYSAVIAGRDVKKSSTIFSSSNKSRIPDSESPETWFAFLVKLFLLVGVCVGGYYGYQEYQRRKLYGETNWGGSSSGGFGGEFSNHKRF